MSRLSRRLTRPVAIFATMAATMATLGLISAAPAFASTTTSSCNDNVVTEFRECTSLTYSGGGAYIVSLTGYATNANVLLSPAPKVHIELYSTATGSTVLIKNCAQVTVGTFDSTPKCTWNGSTNVDYPSGDYCSRVWWNEGGGLYEDMANECVRLP